MSDVTKSLVTDLVKILGTALVMRGIVSTDQAAVIMSSANEIVGALMVAGPVVWDAYQQRKAAKIKAVAAMPPYEVLPAIAEMPGVKKIVTDPVTADATPSDKVVSQ